VGTGPWHVRTHGADGASWIGPGHRLAAIWVAVTVAALPLITPTLPGNTGPVDGPMAVAIMATLLWLGSTRQDIRIPYVFPMGLLMFAGALAAMLGSFPVPGGIALVQDLILFAWCTTVVNVCRTPHAFRFVVRAWAWSAAAWGAVVVVGAVGGLSGLAGMESAGGRAALTFQHPNQAGNYFLVSLMVAALCPPVRRRVGRASIYGLILAGLLFSGSMAALIGLVLATVVSGLIALWRRGGWVAITGGLAVVALGAGLSITFLSPGDISRKAHASDNSLIRSSIGRGTRSGEGRFVQFRQMMDLYGSSGIGSVVGHGPAATRELLASKLSPWVHETHNDYAAAVLERGVLGALAFLLLFGTLAVRMGTLVRGHLSRGFRAVSSAGPLAGALVAVGASGFFHEVLHFRHVWALLGLVGALYAWGRNGSRSISSTKGGIT
jgi:O-antigen ligase